ncbi:hypothetical protein HN51_071835 [Arachis hypogaea]|uniref:uncharacterized protein n=1 Tax=Arachis hypogaea TaxID=3818 RepID=UPI000DECEA45|nr:uncharacterized protein LOC112751969 [Arachis hypogaea]QHO14474.1 uncharacterized protein DS421_15g524500 [Arachis hypogaea]QHO14475.1 uncharacterized protein DS421_15g524500 [Arachis hypogaea]QHO14476.1 uncharacterized protein DS421_15g524500 [Arachis hypogaea]
MMESAETGECLWMVTNDYIFGIRVEKLEKLGKNDDRDWKSLLERDRFDFLLKLPESDTWDHFIFDGKLFLVYVKPVSGTKIYQISYVGGDTLGISDAVATGAIPPPPTSYHSLLANIKDEVYLVEHTVAPPSGRKRGLWVLRSGSSPPNWHSLAAPPTELASNYSIHGFVLNDKLFLHGGSEPGIAHVYHPQCDAWSAWIKQEGVFSLPHYDVFWPVSFLGDVGDRSVVLTWNLEGLPGPGVKYEIHALLVDNKDYCILRHQFLDELCEAIQPSFFDDMCSNLNLVDLGNSKVCVIIGGLAEGIPSLCILVVELGLLQEEQQQRFLSVRVLVNRVFHMKLHLSEDFFQLPSTSFLFSLRKGTSDIDRDAVKDHIGEKVPTLTSASLKAFSRKRSSGKDDPSTEGDKDNVVKVAQSKEISLKRRKVESAVVGLDKYLEVSQLKDKARELGMKDMTEALKPKEKESEVMEKIEALTLKVGELVENALKDAKNSKETMAFEMFRKGFDRAVSQIKALAPDVNVDDMDVSKIVVNGVLVDADIP